MKRRNFLGFLGGAVAAGPSAISQAAESQTKLSLGGLAVPKPHDVITLNWDISNRDPKEKAKSALRDEFEEILPEVIQRNRTRHSISALDPNIANLRSVSLPSKIRMTRDIDFERRRERRRTDLLGIIEGWWE